MISSFLMATAIFSAQSTETERQRVLGKFFSPPPESIMEVTPSSIAVHGDQPFTIKGEMWVKPPKGHCLILRPDFKKADKRVCKPTPITWEVHDLDARGRLSFTVLTDEPWDEGTFLSWNTPYRVATVVHFGDAKSEDFEDIPIRRCSTKEVEGERSVTLETFKGSRWTFHLPDIDVPVDAELKDTPNLLIAIDTKQMSKEEVAEVQSKREAREKEAGKAGSTPPLSALALLLTKGYKEDEKGGDKFHVTKRNAYVMESGRFNEFGSPRGMTGTCRYKYKDAPGDPNSGVIECFGTDSFDSIFTLVTCFPKFEPRLKSSGK